MLDLMTQLQDAEAQADAMGFLSEFHKAFEHYRARYDIAESIHHAMRVIELKQKMTKKESKMASTYKVFEDNGGTLHLQVSENNAISYMHSYGYSGGPQQLAEDIKALDQGRGAADWDGNELDEHKQWVAGGHTGQEVDQEEIDSLDDADLENLGQLIVTGPKASLEVDQYGLGSVGTNLATALGLLDQSKESKMNPSQQLRVMAKMVSKTSARDENPADYHQKRICIDNLKNPMKAKILGGPSVEESERILREKFHFTDKQIAAIKTSSKTAADQNESDIYAGLFEAPKSQWVYDGKTFRFNIKLQPIDIPENVREQLSQAQIDNIFEQETEQALDDFATTWLADKPWFNYWRQEGRSGGWFVIYPMFSKAAVEEAIKEVQDNPEDEYWFNELMQYSQTLDDLGKASEALKVAKRDFIKHMESQEFWNELLELPYYQKR